MPRREHRPRNPHTRMIDQLDLCQFQTEGYCTAPELFTPREVAAMQADICRLQREGLLRNVATEGDGVSRSQTRRNLQLCPLFNHSDLFRALPFEPRVTSAISALIGDPITLRLDQIFLKPARDGSGTNWHQDNAYFRISDPMAGVAMWIAVQEATAENGTLHVIPKAFQDSLPHERDPESDHHIRCYPDERAAIPLELPAGGVAFFCYGTPHCTRANRSSADRAGVAFHFIRSSFMAEDAQVGANRVPGYHPVLTGQGASGGIDAYGVQVAGTWPQEVELALTRNPVALR